MDSSEPAVNFLGRREFMAKTRLRTSIFGLRTLVGGANARPVTGDFLRHDLRAHSRENQGLSFQASTALKLIFI